MNPYLLKLGGGKEKGYVVIDCSECYEKKKQLELQYQDHKKDAMDSTYKRKL